jgi:hypothetical protein
MKVFTLLVSLFLSHSWGATKPTALPPSSCDCIPNAHSKTPPCGITPAFMSQDQNELMRQLGFDIPSDHEKFQKNESGHELYRSLATFLEKSDRGRLFYPEYYTRSMKNASVLTLKSKFVPKNPSETDEYFRCSIPKDKYCIYKSKLRPYIGLAAKASGIDYSFLACQAYVESRFNSHARSSVGAIGYSQIQPTNIEYMNKILRKSVRKLNGRNLASSSDQPTPPTIKAKEDIARLWEEFWKGTKNAPHSICHNDLTCYRQAFLAQALWLKTDMLAFAVSNQGLEVTFDDQGDFRIEKMDKGDSLLLLAGSYNIGVTKTIRLVSQYCKGASKLKECLDRMAHARINDPKQKKSHGKDIQAILNYVMRIRDCSQQYSAEKLDLNDDERWTEEMRTEKQNEQRDQVAECLLNPCPY